MTRNTKIKNYLENHSGATVEDYNNQRHRMHIMQAKTTTFGKHTGSKGLKQLLYNVNDILKKRNSLMQYLSRYGRK